MLIHKLNVYNEVIKKMQLCFEVGLQPTIFCDHKIKAKACIFQKMPPFTGIYMRIVGAFKSPS